MRIVLYMVYSQVARRTRLRKPCGRTVSRTSRFSNVVSVNFLHDPFGERWHSGVYSRLTVRAAMRPVENYAHQVELIVFGIYQRAAAVALKTFKQKKKKTTFFRTVYPLRRPKRERIVSDNVLSTRHGPFPPSGLPAQITVSSIFTVELPYVSTHSAWFVTGTSASNNLVLGRTEQFV